MTPLMYTVQNGEKDVVELLLKNGADVNAASRPAPDENLYSLNPIFTAGFGGAGLNHFSLLKTAFWQFVGRWSDLHPNRRQST